MVKIIAKTTLILFITFLGSNLFSQDLDEIVLEVSQSIELDETQTQALEKQMGNYAISLKTIFDKYEEEEPDPQAMLTEIKHARESYHKALKSDIGKEKFKAYEKFVEQVQLEILGEAAGLRLLDLQDPIEMSDQQLEEMKPVMARAMKDIMATLMQYIDKPLNVRNKLKIATSLKSAKKKMDKETAQILSAEQIKKWESIKEAAKESK